MLWWIVLACVYLITGVIVATIAQRYWRQNTIFKLRTPTLIWYALSWPYQAVDQPWKTQVLLTYSYWI